MLRCAQLGIAISDLEHLTVGMVFDMYVEKELDDEEEEHWSDQNEIDRFFEV